MPLSKHEEQQDRLDVLRNEQRLRNNQASTFHQFGTSEAAEARGRFSSISNPTVVGSTPTPASAYPAAADWTRDLVPPEMPLGVDINAMEPTGEIAELKASIAELSAGPSISSPAPTASTPDALSPSVDRGRRGFSSRTFRRFR